jgi:ABC-type molybdate transport system substrate-binding protein
MRRILQLIICSSFFAASALAAAPQQRDAPGELRVMADPALILPLQAIIRAYAVANNRAVTLISTAGKDPARLIEEGTEADLLISADPVLKHLLETRGQIDVFATPPIASARLALVARKGAFAAGDLSESLSLASVLYGKGAAARVVILNPEYFILGAHSLKALQAHTIDPGKIMYAADSAALREDLRTPDTLGILLAPEVISDSSLEILALLPDAAGVTMEFTALVIAGDSMKNARSFLHYLKSSAAEKHLQHFGFTPG